jgi:effector-binding domain-containing protein
MLQLGKAICYHPAVKVSIFLAGIMGKLILYFFIAAAMVCLSSCGTFVGIEKAKYTVLEKERSFEIRQYEPCIIAETIVKSNFDEAGNIAFRRLYNYISGQNRKKESIAMTAPVSQQISSEKIVMTAPVSQEKLGDKWVVSFLMPSEYTMETLPKPLDANVVLKEVPGKKMAAVRYSGTWSKKRYERHKAKLEEFIRERGLTVKGEDIFARYDPPFQIFFLRRNEVLIPIE